MLIGTVSDAFEPHEDELNPSFADELDNIEIAFILIGIFCLIMGIVLFIYDAMADEPEEYFRGPY
ncbi:MAG: hypothetical protein GF375_00500 [Candidatus Omnitrophica bacterium]|nr:hypothetical protein [Candidatus Omnitrophota bacterium]